jgi:hypothetical protein
MSSRVIVFAYHFPPENAIGALRPFRFYKYLTRRGVDCRLITAAAGASATGRCDEVQDPFQSQRNIANVIELGVRKVLLPGVVGIGWSRLARKAAERIIREQSNIPCVIFSTYPPLGAHLAAWRVSSRLHLPWIADFRDPLGGVWLDRFSTPARRRLVLDLERRIVKRCNFVLANTDTAADRLRALYPGCSEKIRVIWNGFDPEDRLCAGKLAPSARYIISHVGELYAGRTVGPIVESMMRLISSRRIHPKNLLLKLIGPADSDCLPSEHLLKSAVADGWLEFRNERISKEQANVVAAGSAGLLLLQPQSTLQVPAKLFDYLQLQRPILAFLPRNSPVERILSQSGILHRIIYTDSSLHERDDAIVEFLSLPNTHVSTNEWFETQFNVQHQTDMLHTLIDRCVSH